MITSRARVKAKIVVPYIYIYMSEDTSQALIESMEHQIDQLNEEVLKLKLKIQMSQSIIKSDRLENIFRFGFSCCFFNSKPFFGYFKIWFVFYFNFAYVYQYKKY